MSKSTRIILLVFLMVIAALVRLPRLGKMDVKGDEVELYEFINRGMTPVKYFKHHYEQFSIGRQMPLPRVISCALIRTYNLDVSLFNVRLPFALAGVLTALGMWFLGKQLHGLNLAYCLAFLTAINPYSVYWSRTAHIYVYPMLFMAFSAAFTTALLIPLSKGEAYKVKYAFLLSLFGILGCYTHMSLWPCVFLMWAFVVGCIFIRKKKGLPNHKIWPVVAGLILWGAFLLPWVWMFMKGLTSGNYDPVWKTNISPNQFFTAMWRVPLVHTFGGGWRLIFTLGLVLGGVVFGLRNQTTRPVMKVLLAMCVLSLVMITVMLTTGFFAIKYYTPLWVLLLVFAGYGMLLVPEWLAKRMRSVSPGVLTFALGVMVMLAMVSPLKALILLPGNPMAFSMVSKWLDENLPKGTPVVLDGMGIVLHEIRPHAPTNVFVTFTVPDVGLEMWLKYRWRDSVEAFVKKFPDAAVLELGRNFYRVPSVGPWTWHRNYFKQYVALTNEQALALRKMTLGPIGDYYGPDTNHIIYEIYYDTKEDIVEKHRAAGNQAVVLFGSGWQYTKTQDLRDWRVLNESATIEVYNLTDDLLDVTIKVWAGTAKGNKQVSTSFGISQEFKQGQFMEWHLGKIRIKPGRGEVQLVDSLYTLSKNPLLVERLDIIWEKPSK